MSSPANGAANGAASGALVAQLAAFDDASTAEEYLDVLEISYDPSVVNVNRLHILKLFGEDLEKIRASAGVSPDPADLLVSYREALELAYRTFVDSTPLEHRLFKVLKDRAPADGGAAGDADAFVPLSSIGIGRSGAAATSGGGCGCGGGGSCS